MAGEERDIGIPCLVCGAPKVYLCVMDIRQVEPKPDDQWMTWENVNAPRAFCEAHRDDPRAVSHTYYCDGSVEDN